ncbi:MAG: iron-sulfur cluster assembly accessory protein [Thermodesulfovibrionales bacterium]|nr:iron-sulfur cluster assembly accessory protein [Thermodesulfovibrionales bacterium]
MLTVSSKAALKAKEILSAEGKEDWGLRIYKIGESCCGPSYGLDIDEKSLATDQVIEKDGLKVFIDNSIFYGLAGMELDYYQDDEREGFIMTGGIPSCASGSSSCNPGSCGPSAV